MSNILLNTSTTICLEGYVTFPKSVHQPRVLLVLVVVEGIPTNLHLIWNMGSILLANFKLKCLRLDLGAEIDQLGRCQVGFRLHRNPSLALTNFCTSSASRINLVTVARVDNVKSTHWHVKVLLVVSNSN